LQLAVRLRARSSTGSARIYGLAEVSDARCDGSGIPGPCGPRSPRYSKVRLDVFIDT
jgi:hypothetical protein